MKRYITILLLAFITVTSVFAAGNERFSMQTVKGETLEFKGTQEGLEIHPYLGKIVFLEFWGTWCAPCLMSIPHYVSLQERYKEQLRIIAIETTPDVSRQQLAKYVDDPSKHIDSSRIGWYLEHKARTPQRKASLEKPIKELKAFIASKKKINYDVIASKDAGNFIAYIAQRASWQGYIPFMIVIDTKGEVVEIVPGMPNEEDLEKIIKKILSTEKK